MKLHAAERLVRAARRHAYRTSLIVAFGLIVILLIAVQFFPSVSEYHTVVFSEDQTAGSPEFMRALASVTHGTMQKGTPPAIFNNGDEFIPAVVADISAAKHSVDITNYIWDDGRFSDQLFAALDAALARGVEVRVLVDAQGSHLPDEQVKKFESLGGHIERFRPITLLTLNLLDRRDHRRLVAIDGEVAYTGGIAINDLWLGDGLTKGLWRDMMFRFTGPAASDLQGIFADMWEETTGEVIAGPSFYTQSTTGTGAPMVEIFSSPTGYFQPVREAFILSIRSAKKTLYLTNPYLLPDEEMMKALEERARAGVDVRILVPGSDTDQKCVAYAGQYNYEPLLKAGVHIYEYNTRIHTKTLTEDGVWSMVGSANFDSRSRALNNEDIIGISSAPFAASLEATFKTDLTHAKEVDPEAWEKRGIVSRLLSRACLLFAKQF